MLQNGMNPQMIAGLTKLPLSKIQEWEHVKDWVIQIKPCIKSLVCIFMRWGHYMFLHVLARIKGWARICMCWHISSAERVCTRPKGMIYVIYTGHDLRVLACIDWWSSNWFQPCWFFECMQWCCCGLLRKQLSSSIFVCMHACMALNVCVCVPWSMIACVNCNIQHDVCMPCAHVLYCIFVLYIHTDSSKAYVKCK